MIAWFISSRVLCAASLVLAVFLSGCASQIQRPAESVAEAVQPRVIVGNVPFHAQDEYQCGPAALAMMLGAQGVPATPDELKDSVYIPEREGSLQVEMVATARARGMVAYPLRPHIDAIITEVDAGHPVLVLQNLRFNWWPQWHFAVVVGYDLEREQLILNSGTNRFQRESFRLFDNTWRRGDRWARVMLPPDQLPATARPLDYVRAVHELEQTGRHELARTGYQAALSRWPDDLSAGFAAANHELSMGNAVAAVEGFRSLMGFHPDVAAVWHNLGLSLQALECPDAAAAAMACAARLAPDDERFSRREPDQPAAPVRGARVIPELCDLPACPVPSAVQD